MSYDDAAVLVMAGTAGIIVIKHWKRALKFVGAAAVALIAYGAYTIVETFQR